MAKKPISRRIIVSDSENVSESESNSCDSVDSTENPTENPTEINLTVPHISREKLEMIAGFSIGNPDLYRRALVHKSIQKLVKDSNNTKNVLDYLKESNERMEFVGDSVIGIVVADYLYKKYPTQNEGYLTKYRTRIVNGKMLSFFAESIGIKDNILMSKQVINMKGMENQRFLEDAFEGFVCAIYYDRGFEVAKSFILNILDKYLDEKEILKDTNYKDLLLRYSQFLKITLPVYNTIKEQGQPHNRQFVIEVVLFGTRQGKGVASIKKEAEQLAAMEAIKRLNITSDFKLIF